MKTFLVLFQLLFLTNILFSQSYQDLVQLKNGQVFQGMIIEQIPNKSIKMETSDKKIVDFLFEDIDKISKVKVDEQDVQSNRGRGYQGISELCYSFLGDGEGAIKLNALNGYRFNPYISLCFGTGLWVSDDFEFEELILPFFLDFRVNFIKKPVSPYLAIGVGYAFEILDDFDGIGPYANLTVGVAFHVARKGKYRGSYNLGLDFHRQGD